MVIRVLHIVNSMDRGGLETFIMNIYRNINKERIQFDFLKHTENESDFDEEIKSLGGKIFSVPPRNQGYMQNKKAINDFFEKNRNYSIIHMHASSLTYIYPLIAAKKVGIKNRIIHSHSTKAPRKKIHKISHAYNQIKIKKMATMYFSCSNLASEWMYGKRINKKEIKVINNAIDTNLFEYREELRNEIRSQFKINNEFIVGHIGRFSYPKNHNFIIDIFNELHKLNNNSKLLLVGTGSEQSKDNILKKIDEYDLSDFVIFSGLRTDVHKMLASMDAFVFPSLYEGLPVTLVEAQASGLKCYVSDQITKEVALTKNIEYLSLKSSPNHWAEKILEAKNLERAETKKDIIAGGFEISLLIKEIESIYFELLKR